MSYLSVEFAVCFLGFFALYWLCAFSVRLQNVLILLANYGLVCFFSTMFALHLLIYTAIIYLISQLMAWSGKSRLFLIVGIIVAVINLFIFKYVDFFRDFFQSFIEFIDADYLLPTIEILIPIGISYYTFHSITYLVSLHKKEIDMPSLLDVALFFSFFPTLIAGPINRATTMLPQIQTKQRRTIGDTSQIVVLIIYAMAKKIWLANYLATEWVEPILPNSQDYQSFVILAAIYAYALQIFLDFSGYTDLMVALALLLGFEIPKNFDRPYAALNMRDFWQRWHISLSTWIRDYLYIPLGGSHWGFTRTQINLMIAMVVSGLWHGAGENFIVWGMLHGFAIVFLNMCSSVFKRDIISEYLPYVARWLTFHFVCLTWVFFYAPSASDGIQIVLNLFSNLMIGDISVATVVFLLSIPLFLALYPYSEDATYSIERFFERLPSLLLPFVLALILLFILLVSPSGIPNFIYASF